MITSDVIGQISLNCSFVLYLLVYLPQIIHNRKPAHIANLSMGMHFILYISYCLDLFYGFSSHLPWQYKTVSIVGLTLLTIQHLQLTSHTIKSARSLTTFSMTWGLLFILTAGASMFLFFMMHHASLSDQTIQTTGYLSRAGFLIYTLPQIIKNKTRRSTQAISIKFIGLSLALSLLDMISAWCLDWGWPNKIGPPVTMALMLIMLIQRRKYDSRNQVYGIAAAISS